MDDLGDPWPGRGPTSSGPEFAPPASRSTPTEAPGRAVPPVAAAAARVSRLGPPGSRLPTAVTITAVGLVAVVVLVASLVARHADTHVVAQPTHPVAVPSKTERADRIEFTTSTGRGELILLAHSWVDGGDPTPANGSYLKVEVEIDCLTGHVDYAPHNFQAFDHDGELFDLLLDVAEDPALEIGTLEAGARTRGHLAFDIPRGEVTLLMSEANDQSVTALRVPV